MSRDAALGYIVDGEGKSLAYFTKTQLFSTRKGDDAGGAQVGTHKDGKLYYPNGDFIGAVSSSGAVSGYALKKLIKLCS
jgi:hypothetical protein